MFLSLLARPAEVLPVGQEPLGTTLPLTLLTQQLHLTTSPHNPVLCITERHNSQRFHIFFASFSQFFERDQACRLDPREGTTA